MSTELKPAIHQAISFVLWQQKKIVQYFIRGDHYLELDSESKGTEAYSKRTCT
jgi:hypothetical protein